jgi:hypothetical protein
MECVIPVKLVPAGFKPGAGIRLLREVLIPGADPEHDPGFAGVTIRETLYGVIQIPVVPPNN